MLWGNTHHYMHMRFLRLCNNRVTSFDNDDSNDDNDNQNNNIFSYFKCVIFTRNFTSESLPCQYCRMLLQKNSQKPEAKFLLVKIFLVIRDEGFWSSRENLTLCSITPKCSSCHYRACITFFQGITTTSSSRITTICIVFKKHYLSRTPALFRRLKLLNQSN